MRKRNRFIILIACLMAIAVSFTVYVRQAKNLASDEFPDYYHTGVWMWKSPDTTTDAYKQKVAADLHEAGIVNVYMDITAFSDYFELPADEKKTKLQQLETAIAAQAKAFHDKGIATYALAGNKDWAKPDYHYIPLALQQFVFDYNAQADASTRFAGIQFDIEPYANDDFFDEPRTHLGNFLTLTKRLVQGQVDYDNEFPLGFAIPFWYDGTNPDVPKVRYGGKEKFAAYHIVDLLRPLRRGSVAVMAYRVKTAGDNGSIRHVRDEMNYANKTKTKVLIGQETARIDPGSITFYGKKRYDVRRATDTLYATFGTQPAMGGFIINDHQAFLELSR